MVSISAVTAALRNSYAAIRKPQKILVGLSGGADSVALLLALCELRKDTALHLRAVHVNHGLRETAERDTAFCRELCSRLEVPLAVEYVHITAKSNIEAAAREERYRVFHQEIDRHSVQSLALAHHLDDQAETVVMHLLYGAGSTGLGGMQPVNGKIWRPFLHLRRDELRAYLLANGQNWCEDESNADLAFTRNRIRSQVIPVLEACAPEAVASIGRTAQILQDEDDCLNAMADAWLSKYAAKGSFHFLMIEPFVEQHIAMQRRILRRYMQRFGVITDFEQTERIRVLSLANSGSVENLPGDRHAFRSKTRLHFISDHNTCSNATLGELLADDCSASPSLKQLFPPEQANNLELRTRKNGDYIQPFGMLGTKSLKEYMIDHDLDRPFRDAWPLVCRGKEVLWVIGIGASEKLRVHEGEQSLQLIYKGDLPDEL